MSKQDTDYFDDSPIKDSRKMRALVVNRTDPRMEGRIGVIIPRLMPYADPNLVSPTYKEVKIGSDALANSEVASVSTGKTTITNFVWARPVTSSTRNFKVPYVGTTVTVYMEDGDPSKLYYEPFGPTLNGQAPKFAQVRSTKDVFNPDNRPNLHILEEFKDGTTIYYNENGDTREFEIRYANGFVFSIADHATANQIELLCSEGHTIVLDQKNLKIYIKTKDGHLFELNDGTKTISLKSLTGSSMIMDENGDIKSTSSGGSTIYQQGPNVFLN